ncbi:MAG: LuxR C-terminal-related transcriptional regulator [Umezawaea sp.]
MIVELTAVSVVPLHSLAGVELAVRQGEGRRKLEPLAQLVRLSELSGRILEHVAVGMSSAQLARTLSLSKQGVDYYVGLLVRKLGAPNRTGMVSKAYAAGVLLAGQCPPPEGGPGSILLLRIFRKHVRRSMCWWGRQ